MKAEFETLDFPPLSTMTGPNLLKQEEEALLKYFNYNVGTVNCVII